MQEIKCSCGAHVIFRPTLWPNGRASGATASGRWRCRQVCWHLLTNMIRRAAVAGEGKSTASWLFTQDEWLTQNACFNPSGVSKPVCEKKKNRTNWQQKDVWLVLHSYTTHMWIAEICQQGRPNNHPYQEDNQCTRLSLHPALCSVSAERCAETFFMLWPTHSWS